MKKHIFDNKEELENSLRDEILTLLSNEINTKGEATILLSGGSTPKKLYLKLAKAKADWSNIKIGLVDDRMVPEQSEYSNARMIKNIFSELENEKQPTIIPLVYIPENEEENSVILPKWLEKLTQPDIVLLGMGEDGHFASLFPNDKNSDSGLLLHNKDIICYTNAPNFPQNRISFTWSFLRKGSSVFLFITGEKKLSILDTINNRESLPIDTVLTDNKIEPKVYWAP